MILPRNSPGVLALAAATQSPMATVSAAHRTFRMELDAEKAALSAQLLAFNLYQHAKHL